MHIEVYASPTCHACEKVKEKSYRNEELSIRLLI